MGNVNYKRLFP